MPRRHHQHSFQVYAELLKPEDELFIFTDEPGPDRSTLEMVSVPGEGDDVNSDDDDKVPVPVSSVPNVYPPLAVSESDTTAADLEALSSSSSSSCRVIPPPVVPSSPTASLAFSGVPFANDFPVSAVSSVYFGGLTPFKSSPTSSPTSSPGSSPDSSRATPPIKRCAPPDCRAPHPGFIPISPLVSYNSIFTSSTSSPGSTVPIPASTTLVRSSSTHPPSTFITAFKPQVQSTDFWVDEILSIRSMDGLPRSWSTDGTDVRIRCGNGSGTFWVHREILEKSIGLMKKVKNVTSNPKTSPTNLWSDFGRPCVEILVSLERLQVYEVLAFLYFGEYNHGSQRFVPNPHPRGEDNLAAIETHFEWHAKALYAAYKCICAELSNIIIDRILLDLRLCSGYLSRAARKHPIRAIAIYLKLGGSVHKVAVLREVDMAVFIACKRIMSRVNSKQKKSVRAWIKGFRQPISKVLSANDGIPVPVPGTVVVGRLIVKESEKVDIPNSPSNSVKQP